MKNIIQSIMKKRRKKRASRNIGKSKIKSGPVYTVPVNTNMGSGKGKRPNGR